MRAVISKLLIEGLTPAPRPYEIRDTRLKGFLLRVQPSGAMTYYVEFARGRRIAIGRANAIKFGKAREKAKAVLLRRTKAMTQSRRCVRRRCLRWGHSSPKRTRCGQLVT